MVVIENLTRDYVIDGNNVRILNIPAFSFADAKTYMIKGRSGSGKTTLLNLISGIETPTCGKILIDGVDIFNLVESSRDLFRANHIGYLFQDFNLFEHFTALENIVIPLKMAKGYTAADAKRRGKETLEWVRMEGRAATPVRKLSGGEKQRVALARAVSGNAKIILADEPVGALDIETGKTIMDLILRLARETNATLIAVSHDREYDALFDVVLDIAEIGAPI